TGLISFDGPLTGSVGSSLEDLVVRCKSKTELKDQIVRAHKQGRQLAGFNHPMYPSGDPRATFLIEFVRALPALSSPAQALVETLDEVTHEYSMALGFPSALCALQLALALPPRS